MPIPLGILAVSGASGADIGAYELIASTILTSSQTSVTFSNLNSYTQYKHFQIRGVARTDNASVADVPLMTFNGDSGSNYTDHYLAGDGSGVISSNSITQNNMEIGVVYGNTGSTNSFTPFIVDILDFSSSSKNKTIRTITGSPTNLLSLGLYSGVWRNTAALTSIVIDQNQGSNFLSGSRISLYGLRG